MKNTGFFPRSHVKFSEMIPACGILRTFTLISVAISMVPAAGGCGAKSNDQCVAQEKNGAQVKNSEAEIQEIAPPLADLDDRTTWDSCFVAGKKVGYRKTTVSHEKRGGLTSNGQTVVKIESISRLSVQRFGQPTEMTIQLVNYQTTDGCLIGFESSSGSLLTKGRVEDGRLVMDVSSKGMKRTTSIPWSKKFAGLFGVGQMLLGNPMKPGQRRAIRTLMPIINQVATTNLAARDYEPIELGSGTYRLLRIDITAIFPDGQKMHETMWTNRKGDKLKTYGKAAHLELIRTTEADALDKTGLGDIDLGTDMKITVGRPLKADEIARRARYRIHLEDGDPAAVLIESASQKVRALGPETAEVTVYALRPGDKNGNPNPPASPPDRDDIEANNLVQSDNPKIIAMAEEAAGELKDPWQVAVAMERYVKEHITEKGLTTAFATAAEVADSRQGDCTEHAVLLAALARARGIPARGAMGLVYLPEDQAFFYHMWTEVFIDNRWIPLDATMGKGGCGAGRLKLAESNLKGASAFSSFLPVTRVMGRMKIEVLDGGDSNNEKNAENGRDAK